MSLLRLSFYLLTLYFATPLFASDFVQLMLTPDSRYDQATPITTCSFADNYSKIFNDKTGEYKNGACGIHIPANETNLKYCWLSGIRTWNHGAISPTTYPDDNGCSYVRTAGENQGHFFRIIGNIQHCLFICPIN